MGRADLASKWLDENDPKRHKARHKPIVHHKRAKQSRKTYFAAFDEWTQRAITRQRDAEKQVRGLTYGDGFNSRSDFIRRFIYAHQNHTCPDCLLIPFALKAESIIIPGVGKMAAAAYMCELAHGKRKSGQVARHLCGNGHMSCVNPRHLAWGTDAENQNDYRLHTQRPHVWPVLSDETITQILDCDLPHTVTAIHHQIPVLLIDALRAGRCPIHYRRT